MKVTLGGDRLGSGNKNKIALRNYERSTHNLSQKFTSSMQCGTLYPFLCIPAMRGDKFTINLNADARTIPTKGPLFGSFKMQVDLFQCDVRLYQAILHNNPLAIGLKMGQVKFPTVEILDATETTAFSNSCLLKYLGLSGIGHLTTEQTVDYSRREVNAIPMLAYYEIFKTYYANKQEDNAYVIATEIKTGDVTQSQWGNDETAAPGDAIAEFGTFNWAAGTIGDYIMISLASGEDIHEFAKHCLVNFGHPITESVYTPTGSKLLNDNEYFEYLGTDVNGYYKFQIKKIIEAPFTDENVIALTTLIGSDGTYEYEIRGLEPFALANIDDMRLKLLSYHTLGSNFRICGIDTTGPGGSRSARIWDIKDGTDHTGLPYVNMAKLVDGKTFNATPLNGLVVKTYQSDLFNNWVNTEWIDGENGIANVTAISTASGSIKIDSLNLSEKLYNMLNRVAVSDGSYEGWQDAVYTETPKRHIESPVYLGGMSSEIMFEEIVQSAPAGGDPLGTLGGKGKLIKRKGGHVTVKCNEACFIIGIVSLTPRVNYTQGNEWYLTDLLSMDDFHKPALDGIGFQNLIAERAAWWDTELNEDGLVTGRHSLGKVPAWIEYMTAVDKSYGDFAETEGRGFMSLNREYGRDGNQIEDATTYIDPRKYNYAFAYTDIDAQNFWVQIYSEVQARRLMSAKQIPNI